MIKKGRSPKNYSAKNISCPIEILPNVVDLIDTYDKQSVSFLDKRKNEYNLAAKSCLKFLKNKPDSIPLLSCLASLYKESSQDQLSIETYRKILKIKPNCKTTQRRLVDILVLNKK